MARVSPAFTFTTPSGSTTLRRQRTCICIAPNPAVFRKPERAGAISSSSRTTPVVSRTSVVVLISAPCVELLQDELATWLRSQAFDASLSSAVPLSFEPPLTLVFHTSSLPSRVLGTLSLQLRTSILPARTQLTATALGVVPGERRVLRDLVSHLDENHGVTVLYKPRELRLRGTRKRDEYTLVARAKDRRTVFLWAERLQFASNAFSFAPLSVSFRTNGVDIEVRRGDGSACATVCVELQSENDGGVSVLANVVGERRASSKRVLQSLKNALL